MPFEPPQPDEMVRSPSAAGSDVTIALSDVMTAETVAGVLEARADVTAVSRLWNASSSPATWLTLEPAAGSTSGSVFASSGAVASTVCTASATAPIAPTTPVVNDAESDNARSMCDGALPPFNVSVPPVLLVKVASSGWPMVPVFAEKSIVSASSPVTVTFPKLSPSL